jgi:hypothetical protein
MSRSCIWTIEQGWVIVINGWILTMYQANHRFHLAATDVPGWIIENYILELVRQQQKVQVVYLVLPA